MDIMLDLETLATSPDAVVLSIGATAFSVQDGIAPVQFYAVISLTEQDERRIDPDTVNWWMNQCRANPDAGDVFEGPRESVVSALERLNVYINTFGGGGVWANGPDFDCVILRTLYDELNIKCPWRHTQHRCFRTLRKLAQSLNLDVHVTENMCMHNALADANWQALYTVATLRQLGVQS
jgi:hypothetical protein